MLSKFSETQKKKRDLFTALEQQSAVPEESLLEQQSTGQQTVTQTIVEQVVQQEVNSPLSTTMDNGPLISTEPLPIDVDTLRESIDSSQIEEDYIPVMVTSQQAEEDQIVQQELGTFVTNPNDGSKTYLKSRPQTAEQQQAQMEKEQEQEALMEENERKRNESIQANEDQWQQERQQLEEAIEQLQADLDRANRSVNYPGRQ